MILGALNKLFGVIWPIKKHETLQFVCTALLMFLILLSYNMIRNIKDTLVMTKISPEASSFIKLWLEMPAGVLVVVIYSCLCNYISPEQVFRVILSSFMLFFILFAYILYPNQHLFHPDPAIVEHYAAQYMHFKWFIKIWGEWTCVALYIMGELWPLVIFSLLFWQMANKITSTEQARRFYPLLTFFGQSNLLFASGLVLYFSSNSNPVALLIKWLIGTQDSATLRIQSLVFVVSIFCIFSLFLHALIEAVVMQRHDSANARLPAKRLKLGLAESVQMVLSSRYLLLTCTLLISYSMSVNLIEGIWFKKVREYYVSDANCSRYNAIVLGYTGAATLLGALLGSVVMRYFGWFWVAIATPVMLLCVGGLFFIFCLLGNDLSWLTYGFFGISPALFIVVLGALQNILGKGVKYSFFDASKEMVYIPLDQEMQTKGKAAVDIVGAKIGKSLGAVVQCALFTFMPEAELFTIVPLLATLFFGICLSWIYSVRVLSVAYHNKIQKNV